MVKDVFYGSGMSDPTPDPFKWEGDKTEKPFRFRSRPREAIRRDYLLFQIVRVGKRRITDTVYKVRINKNKTVWVVYDTDDGKTYQVTHLVKNEWKLREELQREKLP